MRREQSGKDTLVSCASEFLKTEKKAHYVRTAMSMIFHILLQRLHKVFWLPATLGCNVKSTLLVSKTVHSQLALILEITGKTSRCQVRIAFL